MENLKPSEPMFGKGILVASGFDLGAKSPLDSRSVVNTVAERNAHVTGNRVYEGMLVYVVENKITYQYIEGNWNVFSFDTTELDKYATKDDLDNKVDRIEGMGLSSNDFTDQLKAKLESLENYNDVEIKLKLQELESVKADKEYVDSELASQLVSTEDGIELRSSTKKLTTIDYISSNEINNIINSL